MPRQVPLLLLYVLFLFSGMTGLSYELVWTRELIFVFGGTTYAITTVLVAFLGGLGLGSYVAGRLSHRLRQPGQFYGMLEIAIGAYALSVPFLLKLADPLYQALYPHVAESPGLLTAVRFLVGCSVMLLPATLMGATLPVLVRYASLRGVGFGRSVGDLYGINTLGAMLGAVGAGFALIPLLGLTLTTWTAACLNIVVGLTAALLLRLPSGAAAEQEGAESAAPAPRPAWELEITAEIRQAVLIVFALSGFASMVYQIAWTRVLILSLGSSTYAFTCILAAFIMGLALGSLAVARFVDRWRRPVIAFGAFELLIGGTALLIVPAYGWVPLWVSSIVSAHKDNYTLLITMEFLLIIAITFVPTFLMGAVFPLATRVLAAGEADPARATGRAYAINTIGTILGSFLAGFFLIRGVLIGPGVEPNPLAIWRGGVQNSIVVAALLNALLGAWLLLRTSQATGQKRYGHAATASLLLVVAIAVFTRYWGAWDLGLLNSASFFENADPRKSAADLKIVYYAEGVDLNVAVVQPIDGAESYSLTVNSKTDASTGVEDMVTQLLLGHLPSLLADSPQNACVIGLGSGITLSSLAWNRSLQQLDCVEISDEVVAANVYFQPFNYDILNTDPRVRLIEADGRNHLLLSQVKYDLIVSEPSNPWMAGVANLFSREFFEVCRGRLTPRGLLCVWLHGYQMAVEDFRMVARTLTDVFPNAAVFELTDADFMFVASPDPLRFDLDPIIRRWLTPGVSVDLYRIGGADLGRVLATYIGSGEALRGWAAGAPLNTDDKPRLEFKAARNLYVHESSDVGAALLSIQSSPFESLIRENPEDPLHHALRERVERIQKKRALRVEGLRLAKQRAHQQGLELLLRAVEADPGDGSNYRLLQLGRESLLKSLPEDVRDAPEMQALFKQIAELRSPLTTRPKPLHPDEIETLVRSAAIRSMQAGNVEDAAVYLQQLAEFTTDLDTFRWAVLTGASAAPALQRCQVIVESMLIAVPMHPALNYLAAQIAATAGDRELALRRLAAAFVHGDVPQGAVRIDKSFADLLDDAEFESLISRLPTTMPASAPTR